MCVCGKQEQSSDCGWMRQGDDIIPVLSLVKSRHFCPARPGLLKAQKSADSNCSKAALMYALHIVLLFELKLSCVSYWRIACCDLKKKKEYLIFFLLLCHAKQACPKQDYMTWQFIRGDVQSVRFSMKTVWTLGLRISVISGCLREWVCVAALSLGFSTGLFVRWPMTFSSDMFATAVGTYLCGCSDACKAIVIVNHFPLLLILYKLFYCFTSRILLSA